ncbi:MAG: hypothetical protein JJ863_21565 [Deltaproteobacteria bacterium]|nr:hypothetical protein [Deltaproteobacteria bacterium]
MIERRFKPGDRVHYIGDDPKREGQVGRVVRVAGDVVYVLGSVEREEQATAPADLMRIDERSRS